MKEKDEKPAKAEKKADKKKNDRPADEKKVAMDVTKKLRKALDKKIDESLKRIKKETKKALKEVLKDARRQFDEESDRIIRESLQAALPGLPAPAKDQKVNEVTVDIEPDELHMGDELPVVTVDGTYDETPPEGNSQKPDTDSLDEPETEDKATPAGKPTTGATKDKSSTKRKNAARGRSTS